MLYVQCAHIHQQTGSAQVLGVWVLQGPERLYPVQNASLRSLSYLHLLIHIPLTKVQQQLCRIKKPTEI